ncbi:MAG: carbonic anhydrase family protein [Flavobacteriaceae bacterium]
MITINNVIAQTPETQKSITSNMAIELLKKGNERFVNNTSLNRIHSNNIESTTNGQYPFSVVLSCIDSRVPTEIIFDQGIGDMFNACVAGNVVNEDILGSMEYACKYAGVKLVVVLGHTSCGAVKGACDSLKDGNLTNLLGRISPAIKVTKTKENEARDSSNIDYVNRVATNNVALTKKDICAKSKILNDMYKSNEIDIVTAMYDVKTGKVIFLNK